MKITKIGIVAAVILFIVGIVAGNFFLDTNNARANSLLRQAQAGADAFKNQLSQGSILHLKHKTYQRYGPQSELISKLPLSTPEVSYIDQWLQVDEELNFFTFNSKVTDTKGEIYQESIFQNDELVIKNSDGSTHIQIEQTTISVVDFLQYAAARINRLIGQGWQIMEHGFVNDMNTVVLEKRNPYQPPVISSYIPGSGNILSKGSVNETSTMSPESPSEKLGVTESVTLSIPYINDLVPHELVHRIEISLDNPLWTWEKVIVVDEEGVETVVMESDVIAVEVYK